MKKILRGLNRPVFLTLAIICGAFFGMMALTAAPKPAYAFGCTCVVPDLATYLGNPQGQNCACIGDKIKKYLGVEASTSPMYTDNPEPLGASGNFGSLTEYFENIWWPRYIHTQKLIEESQLGAAAISEANRGRYADTERNIDTFVEQQKRTADITAQNLGVPENSCGDISLITSQNYLREQVRQNKEEMSKALVDRMSGDPSAGGPPVNQGPDLGKRARYEEMVGKGLVSGGGNNNANKKIGAGTVDSGNVVSNMNNMYFQTAIDPELALFQAELISGNIYQDIVRQDNMDVGLSASLGPILYDQEVFKTRVSAFQQPILHRIAELTPVGGVDARQYLLAAFKKAGYPEELADTVLGKSSSISKAAADWIINELRMYDASMQAAKVADSPFNVVRSVLTVLYQQNAMLFAINESLKNMHMTMGITGLVMVEPSKEKLAESVTAINRPR